MSKEGQLIRGQKYSKRMEAAKFNGSNEALAEVKWMEDQKAIMADIELYKSSVTKSKGSK